MTTNYAYVQKVVYIFLVALARVEDAVGGEARRRGRGVGDVGELVPGSVRALAAGEAPFDRISARGVIRGEELVPTNHHGFARHGEDELGFAVADEVPVEELETESAVDGAAGALARGVVAVGVD